MVGAQWSRNVSEIGSRGKSLESSSGSLTLRMTLDVGFNLWSPELVFVLDFEGLESIDVCAVVFISLKGPDDGPLEVVLLLLLVFNASWNWVPKIGTGSNSLGDLVVERADGLDFGRRRTIVWPGENVPRMAERENLLFTALPSAVFCEIDINEFPESKL